MGVKLIICLNVCRAVAMDLTVEICSSIERTES